MINENPYSVHNVDVLEHVMDTTEVKQIKDFFTGQSVDWALKHSFGYPGESLERFSNRAFAQSLPLFRSFVFAVLWTQNEEYEHYDGQKEQFASRVKKNKYFKKDGLLQLMVMMWEQREKERETMELDHAFVPHLKTMEEKVAALRLLGIFQIENRPLLLAIMATVKVNDLQKETVYEATPFYHVIARLYENFRFKKSECKGFTELYECMLHVWRLSKKEIKVDVFATGWEQDVDAYTKAVGVTHQEVMILHYLLMNECHNEGVKVSQTAKQRVFDTFLKVVLTDTKPINEQAQDLMSKSSFIAEIRNIANWFSSIGCDENVMFARRLSKNFELFKPTYSLLSMLDHPVFTKENGLPLIREVIRGNVSWILSMPHNKEAEKRVYRTRFTEQPVYQTWKLVEQKRQEWMGEYAGVSVMYVELLFQLGIYQEDDFKTILSVHLHQSYFQYIQKIRTSEHEKYLYLLQRIPVEHRSFIETSVYSYSEKEYFDWKVFEHVQDKHLYLNLMLETIAYLFPQNYANHLYKILTKKEGLVPKTIGMTEKDVLDIWAYGLENGIFQDRNIIKTLEEKFMTEQEKQAIEKENKLEALKNTRQIYRYMRTLKELEDYMPCEQVESAILESMPHLELHYKGDICDLFSWLTEQRAEKRLSKENATHLVSLLDEVILEHEKVNVKKIKYHLHVYRVFQQHERRQQIQNQEEEGNELCQRQA